MDTTAIATGSLSTIQRYILPRWPLLGSSPKAIFWSECKAEHGRSERSCVRRLDTANAAWQRCVLP